MLGGRCTRLLLWAFLLAGAPCGRLQAASFIPGDANLSGKVNLTDAIAIFRHLFLGDSALVLCPAAADVDGNSTVDLSDGIRLLAFLFLGEAPPVHPQLHILFPDCSGDPLEDPLGCWPAAPCAGTRGLFFVLSKGDNMREGTKFRRLQQETVRAIVELAEGDEFGIVFFDAGLFRFPASGKPAQGSAAMKTAAIAFVMSTAPGSGSCVKPALFSGLNFASQSGADENALLCISDGFTLCPGNDPAAYGKETLAEVKNRNTEEVPIHAICVGAPGSVDEAFLRNLAALNGGTFTRILQ